MLYSDRPVPKAVLLGLDSEMAHSLALALDAAGCAVFTSESSAPPADVVFCAADPGSLADALSAYPGKPVIVTSRLPEVSGWLDALEAGAADYCAAPFEGAQIRWLLASNLRLRTAASAAA